MHHLAYVTYDMCCLVHLAASTVDCTQRQLVVPVRCSHLDGASVPADKQGFWWCKPSAHCHNLSSDSAVAAAAAALQTTLLNTLACRLDRDTRVRLACNLGKGVAALLPFAALLV